MLVKVRNRREVLSKSANSSSFSSLRMYVVEEQGLGGFGEFLVGSELRSSPTLPLPPAAWGGVERVAALYFQQSVNGFLPLFPTK